MLNEQAASAREVAAKRARIAAVESQREQLDRRRELLELERKRKLAEAREKRKPELDKVSLRRMFSYLSKDGRF